MKFTLDWLNNYLNIDGLSTAEIADHLTMLGLEVDSVLPLYEELAPLRTGLILTADKLANADKLQVCTVQIGADTHQIVCGAPNARAGLKVVVALPGTRLPGDIVIKKAKVRGVESAGMICSERELGLSTDHQGIMELPADTESGQPFLTALGLADTMIEVDLTPNRADCASVLGIARELAGATGRPLTIPSCAKTQACPSPSFAVTIEAPELCPRYSARLVRNVTIGPSPWWLRKRLLSIGLRPINNIVDVTNFVMMEFGQPLHAFDFDTLADQQIVVRQPRHDEMTFTTLDGTARPIDADTLLICDGQRPVALAGIMGGLNSEVTATTTNVLLESACFNPISIRRTARKTGLATDASYRMERGLDIDNTVAALNRAIALFCEVAGGVAEEGGQDMYPGQKTIAPINLSARRASSLIGVTFTATQIAKMLASIGIASTMVDDDRLVIIPPSFRIDIEREADLIEEIARLYGYNNIPASLPSVNLSYPEQQPGRQQRIAAARLLTSIGFSEAINYSFATEKHADWLRLDPEDIRRRSVKILNPLSEDQAIMRTMLLPGLLENVRRNINFQKTAVKLFEIGKVFQPISKDSQPQEITHLAGVLCGNRHGESSPLYFPNQVVDIFDAKGAVEFLLEEMRLDRSSKESLQFIKPVAEGIEYFVDSDYALLVFAHGVLLGAIGKIQAEVLRSFGIKHEVFYFELDFDALSASKTHARSFTALPVYPGVARDIALVVPVDVTAGALIEKIHSCGEKLIETIEIFDVFQGGKIDPGYKSVAISLSYRSASKTLTEKNVEKSHQKIIQLLTETFGGSLRNA